LIFPLLSISSRFNLPVPEESHYEVIRAFTAWISDVAMVTCAREQNIFLLPSPTKTAQFEVKNRRKRAEEAKPFAVCYICLFFKVIK